MESPAPECVEGWFSLEPAFFGRSGALAFKGSLLHSVHVTRARSLSVRLDCGLR